MIATRPVEGISLSLFSEHGYRALEVLARTSTPVRRLTILIVDASAPNGLFPQLATHLPHLEALHIIALVQQYNLVCSLLSSFFFFFTIPMDTPVLNAEDRTRCWRLHRCLKPLPACDFSRSWLVVSRIMSSMTRRRLRSVGPVRARR